MKASDRRETASDRRRVPRGGRRAADRAGEHPALLVAESYEAARGPCVRYLRRLNFSVDHAADGVQMSARVLAAPPDLIIVEDRLPLMPVPRLKEWLAKYGESIPVIVTVSDFGLGNERGASEKMAGVLVKPFALTTMVKEVRRLLRARARSR